MAHRMFSRHVMKNNTLKDILFILFSSFESTRLSYYYSFDEFI